MNSEQIMFQIAPNLDITSFTLGMVASNLEQLCQGTIPGFFIDLTQADQGVVLRYLVDMKLSMPDLKWAIAQGTCAEVELKAVCIALDSEILVQVRDQLILGAESEPTT